jgi:hypothetical protein
MTGPKPAAAPTFVYDWFPRDRTLTVALPFRLPNDCSARSVAIT